MNLPNGGGRGDGAGNRPLHIAGVLQIARRESTTPLRVELEPRPSSWGSDEQLGRARAKWVAEHPQEHVGLKLALIGTLDSDEGWQGIRLARTDWAEVQSMAGIAPELRTTPSPVERSLPTDAFLRPNIAVVHAIVLTDDRRFLAAQRSLLVRYHPGCWSASFEEGLEFVDAEPSPDGAVERAAQRGLREEFGLDTERISTSTVATSLIVEPETAHPAIVVVMRMRASSRELMASSRPDPAETLEGAMQFIEIDPPNLARWVVGAEGPVTSAFLKPLHPTARYRLLEVLRLAVGPEEAERLCLDLGRRT